MGAILSTVLLLAWLGLDEWAGRIEDAVLATLAGEHRPTDMGGTATTAQITEAICRHLA
jgi:isocitrate/isopropylmalate dehydrogenase